MKKLALYLDLIRWSRPAGWLLLLWPTLTALWLGRDRPVPPRDFQLGITEVAEFNSELLLETV